MIPRHATSFTPAPAPIHPGIFAGKTHRHTVRPRGSDDWLLIYTTGGTGLYQKGDRGIRAGAHEVTLYRPGAFQDYRRDPEAARWDLCYAHFLPKPDWMEWLHWPEVLPGLGKLSIRDPGLRRLIPIRLRAAVELKRSTEARSESLALNALEEALLWCDSINPRRSLARQDPRVRKAMDHLIQHCHEDFDAEKIARIAGLSSSRLRHLFQQETGQSPRDFMEQQRLAQARELLALSSLSISEIAHALGFESPFYFSLRFKKFSRLSPREYRNRVSTGRKA